MDVAVLDNSQVVVSGGSIGNQLSAENNGKITISGGEINRVWGRDYSELAMSGGTIKL